MTNYIKQVLPKSLFKRFILILIAPVILSQSIIGIMFFEKYTQTILGIISTRMAGEASAITRLLDMNCEKEYIDELKKSMNIEVEILNDAKLRKHGIAKNHQAYRAVRPCRTCSLQRSGIPHRRLQYLSYRQRNPTRPSYRCRS